MLFQQAFSEEPPDREVAQLVLEVGADRLSAKEEIGAHYELKRVFGGTPEAWRERQDHSHAEQRSELGEVLTAKRRMSGGPGRRP